MPGSVRGKSGPKCVCRQRGVVRPLGDCYRKARFRFFVLARPYCTVTVTVMLLVTLPLVASSVIGYDPGGVLALVVIV